MQKSFLVLCLSFLSLSGNSFASSEHSFRFGTDFGLPYTLLVDGNGVQQRGNFTLGFDGRYFLNQNLNAGMRFFFDMEEQTGTDRQVGIAPGIQYRWLPGERWEPFLRFDLPFLLTDQKDLGLSGGAGLLWNLGNAIGIENFSLRADFNLIYLLGLGNAVDVFMIEFLKIGLDYHF